MSLIAMTVPVNNHTVMDTSTGLNPSGPGSQCCHCACRGAHASNCPFGCALSHTLSSLISFLHVSPAGRPLTRMLIFAQLPNSHHQSILRSVSSALQQGMNSLQSCITPSNVLFCLRHVLENIGYAARLNESPSLSFIPRPPSPVQHPILLI